ncbi:MULTISPECIES: hypothetical protein [Tissierellales]|jgi:hypothetical protein|uniref:Uncharacterized protein n=1 Tax=Acidilutibacter cellobiosedens TaxID=2507161 RepID=A0A410QCI2_9FIRM|nr:MULTISPECIES: hypothetical protein [Tissierellales]MBE6082027.1 hypothetical protein [Tissierellaceae bacterium]QAT61707.1 hypothetical protein EQM13_08960 [Acidilutibacter cellobiosedens]SCL82645.1 hypothetical protein PP176A_0303 [Sporanaerobacter sp. PP17-6a]
MFINFKSVFNALKIISFLLFVFALAQVLTPLKIQLYGSEWLFMYSCCILGTILGIIGNKNKNTIPSIKKIGKIGVFGNLIMVIMFFPPLYFIWGTWLESIF